MSSVGSVSTSGKDWVLTRPRDLPSGGEFAVRAVAQAPLAVPHRGLYRADVHRAGRAGPGRDAHHDPAAGGAGRSCGGRPGSVRGRRRARGVVADGAARGRGPGRGRAGRAGTGEGARQLWRSAVSPQPAASTSTARLPCPSVGSGTSRVVLGRSPWRLHSPTEPLILKRAGLGSCMHASRVVRGDAVQCACRRSGDNSPGLPDLVDTASQPRPRRRCRRGGVESFPRPSGERPGQARSPGGDQPRQGSSDPDPRRLIKLEKAQCPASR